MDHVDYTVFSADDFLLEESFQTYALNPAADTAEVRFWREWIAAHPQRAAEVGQALALIQALRHAQPAPPPAGLRQAELLKLRRAVQTTPNARPLVRRRRVWAAVFTLLVLLIGGGLVYRLRTPALPSLATTYTTRPGEHRAVQLPDGSVVQLNGNSTLSFAANWGPESAREVWLNGEGFFDVTHLATKPIAIEAAAPNTKFVVHAGKLNVMVLGTRFNVNTREGNTQVVLSAGKVAVERHALLGDERLLMTPGDLVETSAAEPALNRRRVEPELYTAWAQGRLEFRRTPVREIVTLLRDSYGMTVTMPDALLSQTITGSLPGASADVLLAVLAKSLDAKVVREGSNVELQPQTETK